MRSIYILVFLICGVSPALQGQQSPEQQLKQISAIEQAGRFSDVPPAVSQLIQSNPLSQDQLGRANLMLGIANQQRGAFRLAKSEFEQAAQILSKDSAHQGDYAAALDNLARIYLEMGQSDVAFSMEHKILALYGTLKDHGAAARSYVTLASLELNHGHAQQGKEYLSQALREAKHANNLDDDFAATISSTQAWLAQLNGDTGAAISGYERAVTLWTKSHGERHMLTGWGYMLLGKSYAQAGQDHSALESMRKGLSILTQTIGPGNPKYSAAELVYSQVLDHSGAHTDATHLRELAEKDLEEFNRNGCTDCSANVTGFQ